MTVPDGVTAIAGGAFRYCDRLTGLVLPEGLRKIGPSAMEGTKLTRLAIPEGVTELGAYALRCCFSLEELYLPDTLERIGQGAMESCARLTGLTLPRNLREIGKSALAQCWNLTGLTVLGKETKLDRGLLGKEGPNRQLVITAPAASPAEAFAAAWGIRTAGRR